MIKSEINGIEEIRSRLLLAPEMEVPGLKEGEHLVHNLRSNSSLSLPSELSPGDALSRHEDFLFVVDVEKVIVSNFQDTISRRKAKRMNLLEK
jgi:hypothetical protein